MRTMSQYVMFFWNTKSYIGMAMWLGCLVLVTKSFPNDVLIFLIDMAPHFEDDFLVFLILRHN